MNTDRKAKLEKALAYNNDDMRGETYSEATKNWMEGSRDTYANLAPLHAALIEAMEALEEFADFDNQYEPEMVCWPASEYMKKSRIALAKLDKALGNEKT